MEGIVDSHTHVFPTLEAAAAFRGSPPQPLPCPGDLDDARRYRERFGVQTMVLLPLLHVRRELEDRSAVAGADAEQVKHELASEQRAYNTWVADVARAEPESYVATVSVDPVLFGADWARNELERALAAGARAIKVMPSYIGVRPDDPRMDVVWEVADAHALPVVSQSGLTDVNDVSHPDNFAAVAARFPRLKLILAHMGLGAEARTIALTAAYDNVYVDTSAWFNFSPDPGSWVNVKLGRGGWTPDEVTAFLRAVGIDRVLFGTNYAIRDPAAPHDWIRSLPLTDAERRRIFSENYARVF